MLKVFNLSDMEQTRKQSGFKLMLAEPLKISPFSPA